MRLYSRKLEDLATATWKTDQGVMAFRSLLPVKKVRLIPANLVTVLPLR